MTRLHSYASRVVFSQRILRWHEALKNVLGCALGYPRPRAIPPILLWHSYNQAQWCWILMAQVSIAASEVPSTKLRNLVPKLKVVQYPSLSTNTTKAMTHERYQWTTRPSLSRAFVDLSLGCSTMECCTPVCDPIETWEQYWCFVVIVMATLSGVLCSLKAFSLHGVGHLLSPRMVVPPSFSLPPPIYVRHFCSIPWCVHCALETRAEVWGRVTSLRHSPAQFVQLG